MIRKIIISLNVYKNHLFITYLDGSIDIDGQKAGRILTPYMSKILRTGGAY